MHVLRCLMILCAISRCVASGHQTDSLMAALHAAGQNDTTRVLILNELSASVWGADPDKAREYAEEALTLARKLNFTKGLADSYREMCRYYWSQTEYDKSTEYALMAIREYERCHDLKGISFCYSIMGSNYSQANNLEKALYYHNLALELNTRIKNISGISRNLNSIGYINELRKEYGTALDYYKQALDLRLKEGSKDEVTLSYANVGSIYLYIGDYSLSLEYLFRALPLAIEINNKNYIALVYQNIGEVYYKTGKYKDGELYLKKSLQTANEIGDKKRREGVYEAFHSLEHARGNHQAAYHYLKLLQGLRDTLYTQDRSRQMASMEALYETEKKEQTIRLLEQEKRIQTMWRNILIAAIVMALMFIVVIYRLQRSRTQKANELLRIQQSLNDKLTEIDLMKSRFFANISHEFRTPLTLILAPIEEKLSGHSVDSSEKESLLLIRRNANRLLDLVNQLLDLSKLEAGKMFLSVKKGDLNEFLQVVAGAFDSIAGNRRITFVKDIHLDQKAYWFDADVLEKILNNLLSNAFKFTPSGGLVTLLVQTDTTSQVKGTRITIQVTDTGRGISTEHQSKIFSPFYQAGHAAEDGQPGTGLGLALIKELIKLYGGTVGLTSQENQGTSVKIQIPCEKESFNADELKHEADTERINTHTVSVDMETDTLSAQDAEQEEESEGKDIVLVVEDNPELRQFIVSVLKTDFTLITATDGQQGLEQALQHVPSLVLSDLMMPVVDGMELTSRLRSDERTSHIPVILLTAKNEHESKLQGLTKGADDYLTKPFSTEELRIRIHNLIEQRKLLAAKYRERITVLPTPSHELSLDEKFLMKVRASVEGNMGDISFDVEKLAEEISLSRAPLTRKLKALTGLTPNEFIKDLRLKKAACLIRSKSDTITQICYSVGFRDQSYFTKCFKKQFGVSPSEYAWTAKENARTEDDIKPRHN